MEQKSQVRSCLHMTPQTTHSRTIDLWIMYEVHIFTLMQCCLVLCPKLLRIRTWFGISLTTTVTVTVTVTTVMGGSFGMFEESSKDGPYLFLGRMHQRPYYDRRVLGSQIHPPSERWIMHPQPRDNTTQARRQARFGGSPGGLITPTAHELNEFLRLRMKRGAAVCKAFPSMPTAQHKATPTDIVGVRSSFWGVRGVYVIDLFTKPPLARVGSPDTETLSSTAPYSQPTLASQSTP